MNKPKLADFDRQEWTPAEVVWKEWANALEKYCTNLENTIKELQQQRDCLDEAYHDCMVKSLGLLEAAQILRNHASPFSHRDGHEDTPGARAACPYCRMDDAIRDCKIVQCIQPIANGPVGEK